MRSILIILVTGILLRLLLSLTTYHSDLGVFDLGGKLVSGGNILNLYDFSSSEAVFNYPPVIYLFHGFFLFFFNLLGISNIYQFNINLALLKLPYLFFDLGIAYILFRLFESRRDKLLALAFWMFNPVTLYATYMMGQFDIIPTFFIMLSVYLAIKNKLTFSALSLGFGIAFKIFPVFLVIPLLIFGKNYLGKMKLLLFALLPYVFSVVPYIFSSSFRSSALFANQSSKSLYAALPVSGGESILIFPVILGIYYLYIWIKKPKIEIRILYFIPLLLFFIFTHYHPQWLIWVMPLLIIDFINSGLKNLPVYLLIFASWFMSLFFFDPSLTVGIFAPLFPALLNTPSIWDILNINIDYNLSRSIIQTVFASALGYLVYLHFPRKAID